MDDKTRAKVERWLKNSSKFLWGLAPPETRTQKDIYRWLRKKGCTFADGPYNYVTTQLLDNGGIEKLLTGLLIPYVREELFTVDQLRYLRQCWREGHAPDMAGLHTHGIKVITPSDASRFWAFLSVNTQYNYVEGWGELAGLWFEEIDPE